MEGLPFLPGYTFHDITRQKHNVPHNFVYKNGYAIVREPTRSVGGEPLDIEGILYSSADVANVSYNPSLTYGRVKKDKSPLFKPNFVLLDKQCLAFKGFFKQSVPNSPDEHYRVRQVNVVYFLEDDTMQISEPATPNAGLPQGKIVRRCRLPKNSVGDYYHWKDLNNGVDLLAYGVVYHICSCDKWTKEYLASQGMEVNQDEPIPKDPYTDRRIAENRIRKYRTPLCQDRLYKFLVYDKKVLRFKAVWDDRDTDPTSFDEYCMLYYLADDTMEISKVTRDHNKVHYQNLLSKVRIPKNWKHTGNDFPSIYLEKTEDDLGEFYTPDDLVIGNTIFVFGRRFLIIDCDRATRDFYANALQLEQPKPIDVTNRECHSGSQAVRPIPSYTGYGTHEDSIQSHYTFNPQPPKVDLIRYLHNMSKILRYTAVLDVIHPDDALREFVIQYRLSDGYVAVNEHKGKNTGFIGGPFLRFTLVPKIGTNRDNPEYLTPQDFRLGAKVTIFGHRFIVKSVDLGVYRYMEANPGKFEREMIDEVRKHLIRENLLTEDVKEVADFRKREEIMEPMFENKEEARAEINDSPSKDPTTGEIAPL
ncbi:EF-hand domain-containing protein [Nesidiocoris tenuis]|uniref:EF-hand domain-containing protein n=1 Tax=Nesidiocoris tenuis TaxID=355587 RepID=A0ABN7B5U9_9HEMI|nr:EF-hand domain-containing protein [Nesidiocoris tenuis]